MEINHYGDTILGVVANEDIVEGRMVLLTRQHFSYDFGSRTDLPGVKLPDTTAEAARARYVLTWAVDNRPTPIYQPQPALGFALRGGFDQAANSPFSATVHLTPFSVTEGQTIPSGTPSLAFGEGIYTVPSGAYIYHALLEDPGTPLTVADTASDGAGEAGKLKYSTTNVVAEVVRLVNSKLTFKILH